MDIKSLNCPNCNAPLNVNPGDTAIQCAHCGSDLRISPRGEASLFFSAEPGRASPPPGLDLAEVERLTRAGQKINAIKLVREKTNWGLKEAKDFVDALEAGTPPPIPSRPISPPSAPLFPDPVGAGINWERIRQELAHGRKIEAIKLYREQTGVGLKEAKDAVEMFERGQTPPPPAASRPPPAIPAHVNLDEIRTLLATGNKIEAIKRYREQTGLGLKEAMEVIEAMPEARTSPGTSGGGVGCLRISLSIAFFILLLLGGCGLYVQTTDEYACGMGVLTRNREVIQRLGEPVESQPFAFVLGYSSSSDFGGNSSVGFAMYTRVAGAKARSWVYMEISHDEGYPYYMHANLFHDGDNIRISGSVSERDCTP